MSIVNVILSGGVGSRLWPLSRQSRPKQYIPLFDGQTLFQLCAIRNADICDSILVVGNVKNRQLSQYNLEDLGYTDFQEIVEATPRNTAAAIAFAAFAADPEDILLVTPSDHAVSDMPEYQKTIQKAIDVAENDYLVTFGIQPTRPETGYGYIEYDDIDVIGFKEKPDFEVAKEYVSSGRYLWNSGMFCFRARVFLDELKKLSPDIYETSLIAWNAKEGNVLDEELSKLIPSESVDYAVMEKSKNIKVVPADFGWSDLGSYDSLWDYLDKHDAEQPSRQNLVLGTNKHVEFLGVDNLVFVETKDAILILPRTMSQDVKSVYERLGKEKPELLK